MPNIRTTRDLFAELYVAGLLADAGWHLYFPKRDFGFDFMVSKPVGDEILIRPVQVKGRYPTPDKTDKKYYGFEGELSQLHQEMVLAIPYFPSNRAPAPLFTAFLPRAQIREQTKKPGYYRAVPASFRSGQPVIRRDFRRFFDDAGLSLMESQGFAQAVPQRA